MSSYNYSLTTFSSSGKLTQIEYALNAVGRGVTSVGVKALNGGVLVVERKSPSPLADQRSMERIAIICDNIGVVYSGLGPDARILIAKARKIALTYRSTYGEYPTTSFLVKEVAAIMQEYTQSGGVRPFGVSLLICGWDSEKGSLVYQVDPSGAYFAWKACAIGKGMVGSMSFLEKRHSEDLDLEDAIYVALLTLKEGFEGEMSGNNIEIGIVDSKSGLFKMLSPPEIEDHLHNL